MEQYGMSIQEVMATLKCGEEGLSAAEAERRLAQGGRNAIEEGKKRSKLLLFFSQFADLMTVILILAAVLSAVLAFVTGDRTELADTGILLFVILLNAVVGFLQQYRADAAIEKLKKLSACEAKAVRGGRVVKVDAETLVPGDVIELEEGDRVPADCRILSAENFRCDESMLTGESRAVRKYDCVVSRAALSARANTAHLGTFCVSGRARCLVTACGMDTEMGRIARLLHKSKPAPAPLDKTVARLGKVITFTVISIAAALFLASLFAGRVSFLESLMSAVAVAVAAIPEGMGAVAASIAAPAADSLRPAAMTVNIDPKPAAKAPADGKPEWSGLDVAPLTVMEYRIMPEKFWIERHADETHLVMLKHIESDRQFIRLDGKSRYIEDRKTGDRYMCRGIEGVGKKVVEAYITGHKGDVVRFTLIFPPLDDQVDAISIRKDGEKTVPVYRLKDVERKPTRIIR